MSTDRGSLNFCIHRNSATASARAFLARGSKRTATAPPCSLRHRASSSVVLTGPLASLTLLMVARLRCCDEIARAHSARFRPTGSGVECRRHCDSPAKESPPFGPAKARPRTHPPRPPTSTVLLAPTGRCAGFRRQKGHRERRRQPLIDGPGVPRVEWPLVSFSPEMADQAPHTGSEDERTDADTEKRRRNPQIPRPTRHRP